MPKRLVNALTTAQVKSKQAPGDYADGFGLALRVDASGNKRWMQRLRVGGQQRNLGLGSFPAVSLNAARETALANYQMAKTGKDPVARRQAQKVAAKQRMSNVNHFQEVSEKVIALRSPHWSERHARQARAMLENHAYPAIGRKMVYNITSADVLAVLEPIWHSKPDTASRLLQRLNWIFEYAIVAGWIQTNPAQGVGRALGPRPRNQRHHPALPYDDVPAFVQSVRQSTAAPLTKLAFEFLILTAVRAGEVRGATWDEINLEKRTWEIPAERMKMRRPHRVPLSPRVMEILAEVQAIVDHEPDGLVFPSKQLDRPLSNMVFEMVMRRLEVDAVPHGFRSSFRDWSLEQTGTPWAVAEAALAHGLGNGVEKAYARTDLFNARRDLMDSWAAYCTTSKVPNR